MGHCFIRHFYTKGKQSFNLVLIRNENNDITNNVSIICPNSSFSSNYLYNKNRYSIIIYNKDNYYEPIISLNHYDGTKRMYKRFFDVKEKSNELHNILNNINANIINSCKSNFKDTNTSIMTISIYSNC